MSIALDPPLQQTFVGRIDALVDDGAVPSDDVGEVTDHADRDG